MREKYNNVCLYGHKIWIIIDLLTGWLNHLIKQLYINEDKNWSFKTFIFNVIERDFM